MPTHAFRDTTLQIARVQESEARTRLREATSLFRARRKAPGASDPRAVTAARRRVQLAKTQHEEARRHRQLLEALRGAQPTADLTVALAELVDLDALRTTLADLPQLAIAERPHFAALDEFMVDWRLARGRRIRTTQIALAVGADDATRLAILIVRPSNGENAISLVNVYNEKFDLALYYAFGHRAVWQTASKSRTFGPIEEAFVPLITIAAAHFSHIVVRIGTRTLVCRAVEPAIAVAS